MYNTKLSREQNEDLNPLFKSIIEDTETARGDMNFSRYGHVEINTAQTAELNSKMKRHENWVKFCFLVFQTSVSIVYYLLRQRELKNEKQTGKVSDLSGRDTELCGRNPKEDCALGSITPIDDQVTQSVQGFSGLHERTGSHTAGESV
jgi:hypothetical protein